MQKTIIELPDGTRISSGSDSKNAIRACSITESVNVGTELNLGSAYANKIKVDLFTPGGGLDIAAGSEVTVFKDQTKIGIFVLEKPTRPTANTMKLTGYDRIVKLDKDLTEWLKTLTGWPYKLIDFAKLICEACGLALATDSIPNGEYIVSQFSRDGVTGRQLMTWIGEVCCRFCKANAEGKIELAWYASSGKTIAPVGELYYFRNSFTYENYQVAPIDAVQLRLTDSEDGYVWPAAKEGANTYIISGNPLLNRLSEDMLPVLQVIEAELSGVTYTPCKVSLPVNLDIRAGHTVQVTDSNGVTVTLYVMAKTTKGQTTTLECTGSPRRDSASAQNNKSVSQIAKDKASNAASSAKKYTDTENEKLNQLELLKRLTKEWVDDAIYLTEDGKIAFKASAILTGVLMASLIQTGILQSKDGKTFYLDLDNGILRMQATEFSVSGKTVEQIAEGKAGEAVKAQTQLDILNKLTNNGMLKGLFMYNGELCVNASAILTGILKGVEIIGEFGTIGGFTMSDHTLSAVFRKDYPAFTQADLEKAVAYRVGSTTLTAEEIEKYDVNMTGDVDTADVSTMQGMMEGTVPTYSEGRIILDATNPKETIVLEVTAGYRAGERLALGMGLAKATKFIADTFACGADNGYTGTVTAGDKTLTIKGGIITSVS